MKILVLSCNTGGGHNAAARAIKRELNERGDECVIRNALDFTPRIKQVITEEGHSIFYKWMPELYGESYNKISKKKKHPLLYLDYARFAPEIAVYINENHFDAVICVHVFPAMMLSAWTKLLSVRAKRYFVATDYSVAPCLEGTHMDAYFVPNGCGEIFRKKLPKAKIVETGIPIDSRYYDNISQSDARKALGLRDDESLVVIGAGSIGCGPIQEIAERIKLDSEDSTYVAVLCGNNNKLREELSENTVDARFLAIGFTDNVRYWTKAADVFISKAGGLSTTEIASAGVPLILMDAVPGLEQINLDTFVAWGCAATASTTEGICNLAREFCNKEELRETMIDAQKKNFSTNAVKKLVDYISGK